MVMRKATCTIGLLVFCGIVILTLLMKLTCSSERDKRLIMPRVDLPAKELYSEKNHLTSDNYDFKGKVVRKINNRWNLVPGVCAKKDDFILSSLKKPRKLPIYIYPVQQDKYVSGSVARIGGYEMPMMLKIFDLLKHNPDSTFVDIGSNIGVYSLTAASAGNYVISVDCIRGNVDRLCASMRASNLLHRATIIHNALSNKHETVTLIRTKQNIGGTFIKNYEPSLKNAYNTNETINTILLDEILDIAPLKSVILKIDAEGAEADIFAGGEIFFRKAFVKYMLIEVLFQRDKPGGQFIFEFLKRHNMTVLHPGTEGFDPNMISSWRTVLVKNNKI